jgi:L-alanine-DL-glutamate epimerase-like enolase superfamily enzyme
VYGLTISPSVRHADPGSAIRSVEPIAVTHGTEREAMSFLFVRVETADGTVGYGEACDSYGCSYASVPATVVSDVYEPLLVGAEATGATAVAESLVLATRRRLGSGWAAAQARSAVELALWDVVGRRAGHAVSRLIGRHRDRVEVYASIGFLEEGPVDHHLGGLAPLLDRGVKRVKTRIGPDWRADVATLAGLREALGDEVELMVDGSETFTVATAALIAPALADLGVSWFEEPVPQPAHAGIAELARRSPVPLAYGEHLYGADEAIGAMANGELLVLQPDASTGGGLGEARAMAMAAAGFGVRVVPHVCAGPVSLAANLHLAATVPAIRLIEYPPVLAAVWATLAGPTGADLGPDEIVDGTLAVPDSPGLGVDLDEAAAARFPYRPPGTRVAGTVGGLPDRFTGDR